MRTDDPPQIDVQDALERLMVGTGMGSIGEFDAPDEADLIIRRLKETGGVSGLGLALVVRENAKHHDVDFRTVGRVLLNAKRAATSSYFRSPADIYLSESSIEFHAHFSDRPQQDWDEEKNTLESKVRFLGHQLQCDRPYLQLYRLGAGSFLVAALSLLVWAFTGIGAPFHPVFAAAVIPASIGVMVMAFLVRGKRARVGGQ